MFRRPNHDWIFYPPTVPVAIGLARGRAAGLGLVVAPARAVLARDAAAVLDRRCPVVFFQLWPVKGFQYLLPIAPAVAILAARAIVATLAPAAGLAADAAPARGGTAGRCRSPCAIARCRC